MSETNLYIDNETILKELAKSIEQPTEQLHMIFYTMATNIAKRNNFRGYSYKEDMIHEAYIKCVKVYKKFNPEKQNPFAFFTTIIFNTMIDFIKKEHKEHDTKQNLYDTWHNGTNNDEIIEKLVGNK